MPPLDKPHQLERRARAIVESLQGTWSRGKGMCCCPAHDDRTPSLSVTLGRKAILFHCFAGCLNAAFDRPKRALGSLGFGSVRLAPPVQGRLGLAEGIESALSAMQLFGISCWATLGNERFGLVAIPEGVRELHLFIDNDAGGALAEKRALKAYAAPRRQR